MRTTTTAAAAAVMMGWGGAKNRYSELAFACNTCNIGEPSSSWRWRCPPVRFVCALQPANYTQQRCFCVCVYSVGWQMRAVNLCAAGEWHSKNGQLSWPLHCRSWPPWIGLLWRTCDSLSFYWFLVWSWLILECVTHLRHANERANAFVSNISHTHTHGICDRAVCFPEMSRSVCVYLCVRVCDSDSSLYVRSHTK